MPSARVTSIEKVEHFRTALCAFGKDAKDVLCAVDMHIRRTFNWLEEQAKLWHAERRVRQEELTRAKIELDSRKFANRSGKGPGTTDQEKAFRKAKARLEEAEEKLRNCKRWVPLLQHEVHEYQGPARLLSGVLDTEFVQALALLARKLEELEAYLSLPPPASDMPVGNLGSADPTPVAPGDGERVPEENTVDQQTERDKLAHSAPAPGYGPGGGP